MATEPGAPYSVGITSWSWMTARLLLLVVERHEGDLERVAASLGLSEVDTRERVGAVNRLNLPRIQSTAMLEVAPERWEVMVGQMVLEVVEMAPSFPAAAYVLGITSEQLVRLVTQAKRVLGL